MKKIVSQAKRMMPAISTALVAMVLVNRAKAGTFGAKIQELSQTYLSIS